MSPIGYSLDERKWRAATFLWRIPLLALWHRVSLSSAAQMFHCWVWHGGEAWPIPSRFRRMIVRAAPTCTLWRHTSINTDALEFVPWPRWKISGIEQVEIG